MILEESGEGDLNYSDEDFLPLKYPKKELFVKSPTNPFKAKFVKWLIARIYPLIKQQGSQLGY